MEKRKEVNKLFYENLLKVWGALFGILGAITVILPISEVLTSWKGRVILFLIIIAAVLIIAVTITFLLIKHTTNTVYSKEKTRITFEYNNIEKIMNDEKNGHSVVVVPINTELDFLGDIDTISQNSVHGACLKYLNQKGITIDKTFIEKTKFKRNGIEAFGIKGEIGDWFLLKPSHLGIDSNIHFLFLEVNDMEKKGTYFSPKSMSKEEYYLCLDSLMEAISDVTELDEKIYIPLIGAGNAKVGKTKDIMFFMESFLRFNKAKLLRDIHVVIPKNKKNEAPIYLLRKIR